VTLAPELEHGPKPPDCSPMREIDRGDRHTDCHVCRGPSRHRPRFDTGGDALLQRERPVHHREPGPVTRQPWSRKRSSSKVVNDGMHVQTPPLSALVLRAAGAHRIALITDAMEAARTRHDGRYPLRAAQRSSQSAGRSARGRDRDTLAGFDPHHGQRAGTTRCSASEYPIELAAVSASLTPAAPLGLDDRIGTLEPGQVSRPGLM